MKKSKIDGVLSGLLDNSLIYDRILLFLLIGSTVFFVAACLEPLMYLYIENEKYTTASFAPRIIREMFIYSALLFLYFRSAGLKYQVINFLFVLAIILTAKFNGSQNIWWGLRFFVPIFFLISPIRPQFKLQFSKLIPRLVEIFLGLHLTLQLVHLFFGRGYYSLYKMTGLNARNPGFYFFPAASAFLTLCLFTLLFALNGRVKRSTLIMASASIFLCSSITGLITYLFCIIVLAGYFPKREKIIMGIYFVSSFFSLHYARYAMTGGGYIKETAGTRKRLLEVAYEYSFSNPFSNISFGLNTNAAAQFANGVVADSLYTAVFANLGGFWLVGFVGLVGWYIYLQRKILLANKGVRLVFTVFALASCGLIVTEATFPFLMLVISKLFGETQSSTGASA